MEWSTSQQKTQTNKKLIGYLNFYLKYDLYSSLLNTYYLAVLTNTTFISFLSTRGRTTPSNPSIKIRHKCKCNCGDRSAKFSIGVGGFIAIFIHRLSIWLLFLLSLLFLSLFVIEFGHGGVLSHPNRLNIFHFKCWHLFEILLGLNPLSRQNGDKGHN